MGVRTPCLPKKVRVTSTDSTGCTSAPERGQHSRKHLTAHVVAARTGVPIGSCRRGSTLELSAMPVPAGCTLFGRPRAVKRTIRAHRAKSAQPTHSPVHSW